MVLIPRRCGPQTEIMCQQKHLKNIRALTVPFHQPYAITYGDMLLKLAAKKTLMALQLVPLVILQNANNTSISTTSVNNYAAALVNFSFHFKPGAEIVAMQVAECDRGS